ncbi:MAG: serine/threonine protein kinase [Myxococcota bacterium]
MATVEKTAISRLRPPDFIPGYRLEKLVGKGGMGEVHRAVQLSLGRTVAVKILATELAKDETFVARFEKEGAALATLSHPNIVSIVDKGKTESTYYLVMEFVDGPSMREVMRSPLLDSTSSLRMIHEVCRAIDYAHNRGVIHRDLKPENILFDEQAGGIAKVSDFGLAGFAHEQSLAANLNITQTHVSMGTASYMAPEQRVDAKSVDHRADVYSLGVILYELLVGELPVGTYDPPSQKKPGVDKRLDAIVARCLKPLPQDRYQKVTDLLADLEPLLPATSHSLPGRPSSPAARAKELARRVVRRVARVGTVTLVVAATLVLAVSLLRGSSPKLRKPAGDELTTDFGTKWPLTTPGRIERRPKSRDLSLGDGPDTVPVVAMGRKPSLSEGKILFGRPEDDATAGRAVLDVDLDGEQNVTGLSFRAEVRTLVSKPTAFSRLREWFSGPAPEPRSALMLLGKNDRYVALIVSGGVSPPTLEWALGERRGTMSSPLNVDPGPLDLELTIDDETGDLTAYLGEKKDRDRRMLGDPLSLGASWKKEFGEMPRAAVGCLNASCAFAEVRYIADVEPPPPVVVVEEEKKTTVAKVTPKPVAGKTQPKKSGGSKTSALKKRVSKRK